MKQNRANIPSPSPSRAAVTEPMAMQVLKAIRLSNIPTSPDVLLRRTQAAKALTAAGFPVTETTLATKAVRGGGPLYRSFGRIPLYRWGDCLAWAEAKLSAPRSSTSEGEARQFAQ
jgi:hypothetical protein